jgi:LytR cell envelope-related transcriptional attenuator
LALIVTATFLLGHSVTSHGRAAAVRAASTKPTTKTPAARATLPRTRTRVIVLNGNGQAGAAASEAAAIRSRGYRISAVGNAPQSTQGPTLVMYRPGFAAEGRRLARDAGISIVTALNGLRPSSLQRAQLVIVLGAS